MSAIAAPDVISSITSRISSIQSMIQSVSPQPATATTSATTAPDAVTAAPGSVPSSSSTAFASALSDAVGQAGAPAATAASPATTTATAAAAPTAGAPAVGAAGSSSASGITGDDVIASAKKYLGVPYVWGGTTPAGLDCSGLVQLAFKDLGISLPRVSRDQAKAGTAVPSLAQAEPGDLIAFGTPVNHIAIYLGNNQILEAPQPGQDVHITTIHRTPTAIRRIVPGGDGGDASGQFAATQAVGSVGAATGTTTTATTLGVPASLRVPLDPALIAAVPRAVPLASLGLGAAAPAGVTATSTTPAAATGGGFSADQLTAAGLSPAVASLAGDFAAAEQKFNLPAGVLAAVAQAESAGNADAVSSAGAQGLMQLMPGTAAGLGVTDPFDPAQSIDGAAKYLSNALSEFGGSLTEALAAYNAGTGAVRKYNGVPPYAETQNYVRKITDTLARLS